jgi:hypothetical protein
MLESVEGQVGHFRGVRRADHTDHAAFVVQPVILRFPEPKCLILPDWIHGSPRAGFSAKTDV